MSQELKDFETNFDDFTRGVARSVHMFFAEKGLQLESVEDVKTEIINYLQTNYPIQLLNLVVELKSIERGYIGSIKTTSLNKPLFFEIFK